MKFQFSVQKVEPVNSQTDIELFYVIEGSSEVTVEDRKYLLKKDDFMIINADRMHSVISSENILSASIFIPCNELMRLLKRDMVLFFCNSSVEEGDMYDEVRHTLKQIFSEEYSNHGSDEIYMESLYYKMLYMLTHNFLISSEDRHFSGERGKYDDRRHQISEYVRMNYNRQISLHELAEKLYLSDSYLSKNIKKMLGMSFLDYVNNIRLNHVVSEMIYTDQPIVRISMDSGFASPAALNKAFREKYGITPSAYRQKWKMREEKKAMTPEEQAQIEKQVRKHFRSLADGGASGGHFTEQASFLPRQTEGTLQPNWNRMINAGTAAELLNAPLQKQLLKIKKELNFTYVRFWDLYSPEMLLDRHEAETEYNFGRLDQILDFLLDNGMLPFMEIGIKSKILIRNRGKLLIRDRSDDLFGSADQIGHFILRFTSHLVMRYSPEEVSKWYFELWRPEEGDEATGEDGQTAEGYLKYFNLIAGTMRRVLPSVRIGGGGGSNRFGMHGFTGFLKKWKETEERPDFLSVYCYPYAPEMLSRNVRNQSIDQDYIRNFISGVSRSMEEADFHTKEFFVTEWNFSVSNRNMLNDTCMKGAYIVRNLICAIGSADLIGYWVCSDLFADYYDAREILFGGCGLLSRDGIEKPAYYAFAFMNRLGKNIRKTGEHYLITDNGPGDLRIICHNCKALNYQYSLKSESEIDIRDEENLMADARKLKLHFSLPAEFGEYFRIRSCFVNSEKGSAANEWMRMGMPDEMQSSDIEYLKRISTPGMAVAEIRAEAGKMNFDAELLPNEIRLIEIMAIPKEILQKE